MPVLDSKFFQGDQPIPQDILDKLFCNSPAQIDTETATRLGWNGQLVGGIVLQLSEDGTLARRGAFNLLGNLVEQQLSFPASKLWDRASKEITVTITVPTADHFSFLDGGLTSDYMDHDQVDYVVSRGHTPILPAQYEANKIGGFSLRLVAHLSRSSNGRSGLAIRITLLVFPLGTDELRQETDATQSPAWAGIKLLEAECPLFPAAPLNSWGCPVYPFLHKADANGPFAANPKELQHAIAAIMGNASNPTACTSTVALKRFWQTMTADPEKALPRPPHITWPPCERPPVSGGKTKPILPNVISSNSNIKNPVLEHR
jgi:hypothetical protein